MDWDNIIDHGMILISVVFLLAYALY